MVEKNCKIPAPGNTDNGCKICAVRNGGGNGGNWGSVPFEMEDDGGDEIIDEWSGAAIDCERPASRVYGCNEKVCSVRVSAH